MFKHLIRGPLQSGKTTIALGALEKNRVEGRAAAYIVPTREWARLASRRTTVQCLAIEDAFSCQDPPWKIVAVDDVERMPPTAVHCLQQLLAATGVCTAMIVVESDHVPSAPTPASFRYNEPPENNP